MDDDDIAKFLDATADADSVKRALRAAALDGERKMVKIVVEWLRAAEDFEDAPTTRIVADRAGVSHTTVATALKRFAVYLRNELP